MAAKGLRKLVDIPESNRRQQNALQTALHRLEIAYRFQCYSTGLEPGTAFRRYYVPINDLSVAQAMLPAIAELREGVKQ